MEILERALELERGGADVIHMEIGEPDFDTPLSVKEVAVKAIMEGKTNYTHSLGLHELREAVCEHYNEKYGVGFEQKRVIITNGTSPGMLLAFASLLNAGDEAIVSNPCYACYPNIIDFVDGVPVTIPVFESSEFQYIPDNIAAAVTEKTKAIIINSPANPTGTMLDESAMRSIAAIADRKIPIISDEIYHGLVYEDSAHTILEYTDNAVVINGFSKLYAMTGWRLGYLIVPEALIRPIQKLQQNLFISPNNFVQWAGIAALKNTSEDVERMIETYNKRRMLLIKELPKIGFGVSSKPKGAFYIMANAKRFIKTNSHDFALELLEKTHVALTPGTDFGSGGEGYLRFSYATAIERIEEALIRLDDYLDSGRQQY